MVAATTREKRVTEGLPKSGRPWKSKQVCKTSLTVDVPQIRSGYKRMREQRSEISQMKALEAEMKRQTQVEIDEIKRRRRQKKLAKEENSKKSEIVQVISNPMKLKKMNKKQLKMIRKA